VPFLNPRILVGQTRCAYIGPGLNLEPHKMAVATLVIGLEHDFILDLFTAHPPKTQTARIGIIPPHTLQHFKADGAVMFLFLDPIGDDYKSIDWHALIERDEEHAEKIAAFILNEKMDFKSQLNNVCDYLGLKIELVSDHRIVRVVRAMDAEPNDFHKVETAAVLAQLSVSRFQHVFRVATGTTFRRYRIWQRMRKLAGALAEGSNLTSAAYIAGFSSSAHLSTAFKSMFGIPPSFLTETGAHIELL